MTSLVSVTGNRAAHRFQTCAASMFNVSTNDSAISQALAMLNDPIVTVRVRRANNSTVSKVLAATSDPGAIADQLYLHTLSRRPTAAERQIAVDYLSAGFLAERAEDLQFVLINSLEFLFV